VFRKHVLGMRWRLIGKVVAVSLGVSLAVGSLQAFATGGTVSTVAGSSPGFANGSVASGAKFSIAAGVAVNGNSVYVADAGNNQIRVISGGNVTTLAGTTASGSANGLGAAARFNYPFSIAVDPTTSDLIVADLNNTSSTTTTRAPTTTTSTS
jgi:DNA-binding beta-propeller fold protein YncE